ncbi:uncharacterized protein LOC113873034 [Abrus precatorius]|uniref:Uncharacterized protein LOC113873034 n=1 Tax=Abrus precatorius TaxID=3816 RepID=A0A8B8MHU5_ABRPR|nr:uncharacterized protein LOC113873034 [Abrus precatorius]
MGFRVIGFSLLIIIYVINLASSYPIRKTLPSEFESKLEDKGIHESKIEGAASHGGGGGHGGRSHGDGNSGSPDTRGGGAVIPVYAGGASRNRQHQTRRGAANCNLNNKISNMLMITLVYPLILIFLLI